MPNAAVMGSAGGTAQTTHPTTAQGQGGPVAKSFIRASMEHMESAGIDKTIAISASDQDLGAFPIPAYGYIRALVFLVTVSGGVGTAVFSPDAPWNFLKNIILAEPNGATIAQFNSGYDLYLAAKYGGGSASWPDPAQDADYATSTTGGSATFMVRLPVEVRARDGLGSLPNQNAAAAFMLRMTLTASTTVYTTPPPTTLPNVRVRVYAEEWDQPAPSSDGTANQTTPPAMNTTMFWSKQIYPVNSGLNTIRLTRVGNYIRLLMLVFRDGTGARAANSGNFWPDPATWYYDTRPVDYIPALIWRKRMKERYGFVVSTVENAGALNNSVYVWDFAHDFDGSVGWELNNLWLPTLSSTRLEIQGTWGEAGTLEVITNDVAIAGNVFL